MTRAEESALKAYPKDIEEFVNVHGVRSVVDNNSWQRTIFLKGYQQAEEDLALTWEDLKLLWQIRWEMPVTWEDTEEEWYKELLKRFNEHKKLKE